MLTEQQRHIQQAWPQMSHWPPFQEAAALQISKHLFIVSSLFKPRQDFPDLVVTLQGCWPEQCT